MAKKIKKKIMKKAKPKVKPIMLEAEATPQESDEDLRTILNKSDFDKYELDNYLNDFSA